MVAAGINHPTTANTTQYFPPINITLPTTTEANTQIIMRSAGILSNLYVQVAANTVNAATTIRSRKNTANGNQSVSVPTTTSGVFEDTTNTDTIAAGDLINIQSVPGAGSTGTYQLLISSFLFAATTNTVSKVGCCLTNGFSFSTASVTHYLALNSYATRSTEAETKTRQRLAGTLKNAAIYVNTNARTTTTTLRPRKSGADGNLVLSVASGVTGLIEDTTHTDSIAVNDDLNWSVTTGTGIEVINWTSITAEFETTTADGQLGGAYSPGLPFTDGTTNYYDLNSDLDVHATESFKQVKTRAAFTFSNLGCYVTQNDISSASPINFRKNAANGNQSVSITGSTTGLFQDTTHTDTTVATDNVNVRIAPPAVAGTHTVTLSWINVWYKIVGISQTVFIEWEES